MRISDESDMSICAMSKSRCTICKCAHRIRVRVGVRFRYEIHKLRMRDFKIVHIDKLRAT